MKHRNLLTAIALTLSAAAFAADKHDHAHEHKPMHAGVVVEANDMDFELVARPELISLHVRDHGKPASVKGASAKLTMLTGNDKSEATLTPVADDRLEAKGPFKVGPGTKFLASVTLPGKKAINVRFALK